MSIDTVWRTAEDKTPRIGILGGTFDPIHNGHIAMCQKAMDAYQLDLVWILIAKDPPHKGADIAPAEDRYRMVERACAGRDKIQPSRIELDRPGVTYTVDSLKEIRRLLPPSTELYYIVGADTFYQLPTWKDYRHVLELASFIVVPREGYSIEEMRTHHLLLNTHEQMRITMLNDAVPDVSSTDLRRRIAQELPVNGMIHPAVWEYIREKGLYRHSAMRFEEARDDLQKRLSQRRFQHTLGVVESAEQLAKRYGCEGMEVRWAALLHDCAKEEEKKDPLQLREEYGLPLKEEYRFAPQLIHGPLGAILARERYQIYDSGIRSAIARHTTGATNMTLLEKIVLLADAIEAGRRYEGVEAVRELARHDLDGAVLAALDQSIAFVLEKEAYLAVESVYARQQLWIEKGRNEKD